MKFNEVEAGKLITLDRNGRMTNIRALPPETLNTFDGRNPDQVAEMSRIMDIYTGKSPIDARQATAKWLERFDIKPNDPRWQAEFDRLLDKGSSNAAVMGEARRAAERSELYTLTNGDPTVNCVYVNEGPDPCVECLPLGGLEMSLSEFEEQGLMPGDRCLGGDNCLCILIPIEAR